MSPSQSWTMWVLYFYPPSVSSASLPLFEKVSVFNAIASKYEKPILYSFCREQYPLQYSWTPIVAQMVKNPPAMWETWVRSLSWEDPLEKGMATHSSILAWRIPWSEKPGGLQFMESQRRGYDWATFTFTFLSSLSLLILIIFLLKMHKTAM